MALTLYPPPRQASKKSFLQNKVPLYYLATTLTKRQKSPQYKDKKVKNIKTENKKLLKWQKKNLWGKNLLFRNDFVTKRQENPQYKVKIKSKVKYKNGI